MRYFPVPSLPFLLLLLSIVTNVGSPIADQQESWLKARRIDLTDEWETLTPTVGKCLTMLPIHKPIPFTNKDETKFAYLASPEEESVFLTIGVGNDVVAEEQFRVKKPKTKFYGSDPNTTFNEDLYSKFGQFYPFAIGNETKKTIASVLVKGTHVKQPFFHLNIIAFIKYVVKQSKIDHLWLDAEGAEYGLFDIFHRNGELEQNGIVVCQVNMETHGASTPEDKASFVLFIEKLVQQGRYAIVESFSAYHNRLFFVNVEDEYFIRKFKIAFCEVNMESRSPNKGKPKVLKATYHDDGSVTYEGSDISQELVDKHVAIERAKRPTTTTEEPNPAPAPISDPVDPLNPTLSNPAPSDGNFQALLLVLLVCIGLEFVGGNTDERRTSDETGANVREAEILIGRLLNTIDAKDRTIQMLEARLRETQIMVRRQLGRLNEYEGVMDETLETSIEEEPTLTPERDD